MADAVRGVVVRVDRATDGSVDIARTATATESIEDTTVSGFHKDRTHRFGCGPFGVGVSIVRQGNRERSRVRGPVFQVRAFDLVLRPVFTEAKTKFGTRRITGVDVVTSFSCIRGASHSRTGG